jgi:hypothetical protein
MFRSTLVEKVAVSLQDSIVFYLLPSVFDDDAGQFFEVLSDDLEGQFGLVQFQMQKELLVAAGSGCPDACDMVELILVGVFDSEGVVLSFAECLHVLAEALDGLGEFEA